MPPFADVAGLISTCPSCLIVQRNLPLMMLIKFHGLFRATEEAQSDPILSVQPPPCEACELTLKLINYNFILCVDKSQQHECKKFKLTRNSLLNPPPLWMRSSLRSQTTCSLRKLVVEDCRSAILLAQLRNKHKHRFIPYQPSSIQESIQTYSITLFPHRQQPALTNVRMADMLLGN